MKSINSEKEKAWKIYDALRNKEVYSPAFEQNIRFSLKGWRHINGMDKARDRRSINDKYRRYKLLPLVENVLLKATTIQDISKRKGVVYGVIQSVEKINGTYAKLRIILKQDNQKSWYFYSVMDKK